MNFFELAKHHCTTRGFKDEKIKPDELEQILSAGLAAPTACNQPFQRIIVVREPENKEYKGN
ncbi:nitroreductase family protein [Brucepastera parasyntrophica]|uniref:nitroreductase family protein n=1 Tax=Brucepastera parasyntrophica TaxID=2880008 RepID=UPI00210AF5DB|nr:nitroreductase family protein [Brucepastera parasyntrophica]ULQ58640.1 nitroreductase family protein [Brucepastera parasyntrophica]